MTRILKDFRKEYGGILLLIGLYWSANIGFFFYSFDFLLIWLNWNLLLGLMPLIFIKLYQGTRSRGLGWVFLILWLAFLPNAIYMVTDFIHLSGEVFYVNKPYQVIYKRDLLIWARLISIVVGFILSSYLGLESLYLVYDQEEKKGKARARGLLVLVSFLIGIAIYIGRFLRFNSWDIFRPYRLLLDLYRSLDGFAWGFIGLMSLYSLFIFYIFLWARRKNNILYNNKDRV